MTVANNILRVLDLAILGFCSWLAFLLQFRILNDLHPNSELYIEASVVTLLIAASVLLVTLNPRNESWESLSKVAFGVLLSWTYVFVAAAMLSLLLKTSISYSRVWFGIWVGLTVFSSLVFHLVFSRQIRTLVTHKLGGNLVVLVGAGGAWREVQKIIQGGLGGSVRFIGYFADEQFPKDEHSKYPDYLGRKEEIRDQINDVLPDEVWIFLPLQEETELRELLHDLRHCAANIRYFPDLKGFNLINHSVSEIGGAPVINITESPFTDERRAIKRAEDIVLSALILIAIAPLMLVVALAVKLSSPGPILYRQVRLSWGGRPFEMLKFRSMPVNAEAESGAVWARKGDGRATLVGEFIRRTSLDELPQFINVLKGDMSIVGPRPERPIFVDRFKHEIPDYMKKHMVKGGITGWAQVNGFRGDTSLEKRIESDIYYINNWSLLLDIRIILKTILLAFRDENAY